MFHSVFMAVVAVIVAIVAYLAIIVRVRIAIFALLGIIIVAIAAFAYVLAAGLITGTSGPGGIGYCDLAERLLGLC